MSEQAIPTDTIDGWIESMSVISDALVGVVHPDIRAHIVGVQSSMVACRQHARVVES